MREGRVGPWALHRGDRLLWFVAHTVPAATGLEPADQGANLCKPSRVLGVAGCRTQISDLSALQETTERPTEVRPRPMEL